MHKPTPQYLISRPKRTKKIKPNIKKAKTCTIAITHESFHTKKLVKSSLSTTTTTTTTKANCNNNDNTNTTMTTTQQTSPFHSTPTKYKNVSIRSTAEYDSLKERNPFIKHSNALPKLPQSHFPEDQEPLYDNYRTVLRKNTDRLITVRQNNAEPYSYTHQIMAMNAVDPAFFGEHATQLVRPSRLVLDGPGGFEALAYYDHSISMPSEVDLQIYELKSFARTLLLDETELVSADTFVTPNSGLRDMQLSHVPTTFHTNSLITNTHHGYQHDLNMAKKLYKKHINYAETSTALKNIGFWDIESGSADQIVGQHYALPGMLVATTSQKSLGYVAAMGGIAYQVTPIEAAGIMSGQPFQMIQPANPIQINLYGSPSQWISPHEISSIIIQYLGETAFHNSPVGLEQSLSIELTDKGNQFTIDEIATICSTIGSLPNVTTITVPPNANQYKYLRDTNRGAYTQLLHEYGPQLLEPDHRAKQKDTLSINLSQLLPVISVHSANMHNNTTSSANPPITPPPPQHNTLNQTQGLNTVSCPLDYLDAITGTNPNKRLSLAKLNHIDNIVNLPALHAESYHEANQLQQILIDEPGKSGVKKQVLGNRYSNLNLEQDAYDKIKTAIIKSSPVKTNPLKKLLGNDDNGDQNNQQQQQQQRQQTKQQHVHHHDDNNNKDKNNLVDDTQNQFNNNDNQPIPTQLRKVDETLIPPTDTVGLSVKAGVNKPGLPQHPQRSQSQFWPTTPNVVLIRGGYNQILKSVRVMIQCIVEGMKPRVADAYIQCDSLQAFNLLKNDPTLVDQNGIHFFDLCEKLGITILAPGSGNIDAIVSKVVLTEAAIQEKKLKTTIDPHSLHPTILSTDIGLSMHDGGLGHYTPHLFTSGHEHSALTIFTGDLSYDPINTTLSPQSGNHNPNDHSSFFILPSHGVQPEIDPNTNKLMRRVESGRRYQETAITSPIDSVKSSILSTDFDLPTRIDLADPTFNSRYKESKPIRKMRTLKEIEEILDTSPFHDSIVKSSSLNQVKKGNNNNKDTKNKNDTKTGQSTLHEDTNLYLNSPSELGYVDRSSLKHHREAEAVLTKKFISLVNNTNIQQTIYPSQWWNNQDMMNLPILCHANLHTSANDIAGLNNQLKFTPLQSYMAQQELHNWVQKKLFPDTIVDNTPDTSKSTPSSTSTSTTTTTTTTSQKSPNKSAQTPSLSPTHPAARQQQQKQAASTPTTDLIDLPTIFTDLIQRRLQTTPRHLHNLFSFHLPNLQLRYGLSGLRSSHVGAIVPSKPEFVAAVQPIATTLNTNNTTATSNNTTEPNVSTVGLGLGIRLAQLKETLRASQWGSFLLPLQPREDVFDTNNPKGTILKNHFSEETNILWTTTSTSVPSVLPTPKSVNNNDDDNNTKNLVSNDVLSDLLPAIRTFLKLPVVQATSHDNHTTTTAILPQHMNNALSGYQSIQTTGWGYFAQGKKWVLVGDGLNTGKKGSSYSGEKAIPSLGKYLNKDDNTGDETTTSQNDKDNLFRWDTQRGFGYGTISECDTAAKTLKLLGCSAVIVSKFNMNMMRALKSHGILALQCNNDSDLKTNANFSFYDTVSFMTHYNDDSEKPTADNINLNVENQIDDNNNDDTNHNNDESNNNGKRVELFLPNQGPMVILHTNGNRNNTYNPTNIKYKISSREISVHNDYNAHSLVWFRAGSVANAGVELQLRKALVDRTIVNNALQPYLH